MDITQEESCIHYQLQWPGWLQSDIAITKFEVSEIEMGQKQVPKHMVAQGQSVRIQEKATWKGDGAQLGIHQPK